jgi:hypothetical protein
MAASRAELARRLLDLLHDACEANELLRFEERLEQMKADLVVGEAEDAAWFAAGYDFLVSLFAAEGLDFEELVA